MRAPMYSSGTIPDRMDVADDGNKLHSCRSVYTRAPAMAVQSTRTETRVDASIQRRGGDDVDRQDEHQRHDVPRMRVQNPEAEQEREAQRCTPEMGAGVAQQGRTQVEHQDRVEAPRDRHLDPVAAVEIQHGRGRAQVAGQERQAQPRRTNAGHRGKSQEVHDHDDDVCEPDGAERDPEGRDCCQWGKDRMEHQRIAERHWRAESEVVQPVEPLSPEQRTVEHLVRQDRRLDDLLFVRAVGE
jgi:hypothetical protein